MKEVNGDNGELRERSVSKRVFSNFAWTFLSEIFTKGAVFVTNIYIARTLGVENFGIFVFAQTITLYFWLAVDLGTNLYGIREIARDKSNSAKIINNLLTLRITAGIFVFIFYMIALSLSNLDFSDKLIFASCALYLLTYSFYADWVMKGLEKFKYIFWGSVSASAVFVIGTILFVKDNNDAAAAAFIWSISYFFGASALFLILTRKIGFRFRLSFDLHAWAAHIKESIFFTISGALMVLYQYLPILFLSYYSTRVEVGLFGAPYRMILTILNAGFMIPAAFYPVFSDLYERDRVAFKVSHNRFKWLMLFLGLSLGIIGTLFANDLILFVFGDEYAASLEPFKVMLWLVPLYFIRYSYSSVLLATGFQRFQVFGVSAGVLGCIFFGWLLIPGMGALGASITLVIAETLIVLSMIIISFRKHGRMIHE